ncbi:hypothetical protein [Allomuricauda sp. M10]|uniref:hypothetical protein n=1 Tax=Allomuricauda sp. M10 TaxID=2683292 RepID=UPI001D18629C|nr:hypothetical protein [Muricauda sp. M10]
MTLDELLDTFINSSSKDWYKIACWGYGSGPSYRDQFSFYDKYNGMDNILLHREHSNVASFKHDLSITMAWGINIGDEDDKVDRPWATSEYGEPGIQHFLDIFYNNALVFRTLYCVVDKSCPIPFPDNDEKGIITVPKKYYELIKTFSSIAYGIENWFDNYFDKSGIEIRSSIWPKQ